LRLQLFTNIVTVIVLFTENSSTLEEVNANDLIVKETCGFTTSRLKLFANIVTVVVLFTENKTLQHWKKLMHFTAWRLKRPCA